MSHLYIHKNDLKVGIRQGQIVIHEKHGDEERAFPIEHVDAISIFGSAQLSTQLIRECLRQNIPIGYYSSDGHYAGCLCPINRIDPARQRKQVYLSDNEQFRLSLGRRIVEAKIRNCIYFLRSIDAVYNIEENDIQAMLHSLRNLQYAAHMQSLLGFEGNAARNYFSCLSKMITNPNFSFQTRTAHPPKDPINSMLSYGYSLLHRWIYGAIDLHGLHPYFAFLHTDKYGHAALASDLLEELRSILVDRVVIDLVNSQELDPTGFETNENGAIYMSKRMMKKLTDALSDACCEAIAYFDGYGDKRCFGFDSAVELKVQSLCTAIESQDASAYRPVLRLVELWGS